MIRTFFSLIILLIAGGLHVSGASGTLYGSVTNLEDGHPLPGAHIIVGASQWVSFADVAGHFRITGITPGKYEVTVSFLGHRNWKRTLTIRDGKELRLDVQLETASLSAPEVEVFDSRVPRIVQNKPVRMEVLSAQLLTNNPGQSVTSALDLISGVNLTGTMGVYSASSVVSMRGLSGNDQGRTLVVMDGVPLNKADEGEVNWNLLNRENIEKIEVFKGPGSARYGSNAMGGVIRITSKQPEKPVTGMASVNYGTFNSMGLRYQVGGMLDRKKQGKGFFWGSNGFVKKSDGYNAEVPEYLEPGDTFTTNTFLRELSVGSKAGYRFSPGNQVEAGVNYFNDRRGRGMEIYEIDGAWDSHETWMYNARYDGNKGKVSWQLLAFSLDEHFERLNEYMSEAEYNLYRVESKRTDRGVTFSAVTAAGRFQSVSGGVDYRYGSVYGQDIYYTSTDLITNQGKMDTWGLFVQDEIRLMEQKLQITAGLRFTMARFHDGSFIVDNPSYSIQYLTDYQDSLFSADRWSQTDPKLSAQYRFTPYSRVYFSLARGFRAPVLDDLCRTGKMRKGFKVANPSLKPEYLDNVEIGGDVRLFRKMQVATSLFYSIGHDFMYYVSTGDTVNMGFKRSPVFKKQNISKVTIAGFEADINAELWPWLSLTGNYTFNHSVISKFIPNDSVIDKDLSNKFLTDVPDHKVTLGLTIKHKIINFNMVWKYIGQRYINDENTVDYYLMTDKYPSYNTLGARIWRTFLKHYTFAFNIDNIFDVRFIDDRLRESPGRQMNIEFTITF